MSNTTEKQTTLPDWLNGIEIPEWAKWVCLDDDGDIVAFSSKPTFKGRWYGRYKQKTIGSIGFANGIDWKESLTRVSYIAPGRKGERPVHESWNDFTHLFNPEDQHRSQGAFCRWCATYIADEVTPSYLSNAKVKQISPALKVLLLVWENHRP